MIVILLVGVGAIYAAKRLTKPKIRTLDAKICPDGSAVGRVLPNCEFAPCPAQGPPTDTTAPDESVNWKIYRNEENGFEFKYPALWNLETNNFGRILSLLFDNGTLNLEIGQGMLLGLNGPDEIKEYILTLKDTTAGNILYSTAGFADCEPEETGKEEMIISGRRSFKFEFTFKKPEILNCKKETWLYIPNKDDLIVVYFKHQNKDAGDLLNQILSTFKFTQ